MKSTPIAVAAVALLSCGEPYESGEGRDAAKPPSGETSVDGTEAEVPALPKPGSAGKGGPPGDSVGPCPGCRVHVPPAAHGPMRVVVALHGDEGRDIGVLRATAGVIELWRAAADALGFIVLAPACPASLGCNGAWSDWLAAASYRPSSAALAWLDGQVDAIEASYDVRTDAEYLAGISGGAYWLGYYAQARASRFAGVAFVAGGMPAFTAYHGCPACKIPGYFLGGSGDFRTAGQMSDTATAFQQCGQGVTLDLFEGNHEQTIASLSVANKASAILQFFAARPLVCR
jgi:hypothetical protein